MAAVGPPSPAELPTPPSPQSQPLRQRELPGDLLEPGKHALKSSSSLPVRTPDSDLDVTVVVDGSSSGAASGGSVGKPRARKPAGPTGARRAVLPTLPASFTAPPSPPPSDEDDLETSISYGADDVDDDESAERKSHAALGELTRPVTVKALSSTALRPPELGQPSVVAPGLVRPLTVFTEPFPPAAKDDKVLADVPLAESPTASLAESRDGDTLPPLPTAASVYDRRPSTISDRSYVSRSLTPALTTDVAHTSSFFGAVGAPSSPRTVSTSPVFSDSSPGATLTEGSPQGFLGPAPAFTRRHTTGSPVAKSSPLAAMLDSMLNTQSTSVPGVDGVRLDVDILSNAEAVRRRRISRRSKKAQSYDNLIEAGRTGLVDDEASVGNLGGPGPATARSRLGSFSQNTHPRKQHEDSQTKVLVGHLVDEGHSNYILMYNMLTGIRIGVRPAPPALSPAASDAKLDADRFARGFLSRSPARRPRCIGH